MRASSPPLSFGSRRPSAMAAFRICSRSSAARLRERFPDYRERLRGAAPGEGMTSQAAALLDGFIGAALRLPRADARIRQPRRNSRAPSTLLAQADTIYLLGARRVFPVSAYLAYAFGKLGIRASLDRPCRATRTGTARDGDEARRRSRHQLHALCPDHRRTRRFRGAARRPGRGDHRFGLQSARLRGGCLARSGGSRFRRFPLPLGLLRARHGARRRHGGKARRAVSAASPFCQTFTGFPDLRRFRRCIGEALRHQPVGPVGSGFLPAVTASRKADSSAR